MSTETNNGGPAFPCEQGHIPDGTWNQTFESGMSLRDYFAAKAMQAIYPDGSVHSSMAKEAYQMADEMLKARQS